MYDSSKIDFSKHSLYGGIELSDFELLNKNIYLKDGFIEFEVSTLNMLGSTIPVSGGGYLRIFPWTFMQYLLKAYLRNNNIYVLYIHPFELSKQANPIFPSTISWHTKKRFSLGRDNVKNKNNKTVRSPPR